LCSTKATGIYKKTIYKQKNVYGSNFKEQQVFCLSRLRQQEAVVAVR
jgi:hypothetical protein